MGCCSTDVAAGSQGILRARDRAGMGREISLTQCALTGIGTLTMLWPSWKRPASAVDP
jgi:hypothetical protein